METIGDLIRAHHANERITTVMCKHTKGQTGMPNFTTDVLKAIAALATGEAATTATAVQLPASSPLADAMNDVIKERNSAQLKLVAEAAADLMHEAAHRKQRVLDNLREVRRRERELKAELDNISEAELVASQTANLVPLADVCGYPIMRELERYTDLDAEKVRELRNAKPATE